MTCKDHRLSNGQTAKCGTCGKGICLDGPDPCDCPLWCEECGENPCLCTPQTVLATD